MPENLGITKLCAANSKNRVAAVLSECVSSVSRIRNVLRLGVGRVEGIDSNNAIGLIREEARCVVGVDDSAAGKDAFRAVAWENCNRLIRPMIEVFRCCVTPVLVTSYSRGWVVYMISAEVQVSIERNIH